MYDEDDGFGIDFGGDLSGYMNFDIFDIDNAIHKFNGMTDAIEIGIVKGQAVFNQRMLTKINELAEKYGLQDSKTFSSLIVDSDEYGITLTFTSPHAEFVEYGTGIVGAGNPHPQAEKYSWEYASGEKSSQGRWWYPTDENDPNENKQLRVNKETGESYWIAPTSGLPSRPIMYDTFLYGRRTYTRLINRYIKLELKKAGVII